MIRLYVPDALAAGADVAPDPDQTRYLIAVMRLAIGAEVLLFNGRDGEWRATVVEAGKRVCRLAVGARTRPQGESPDLDLVVALVKRGRLETIIEKAAELGARRIRLAVTRRTNADHTNVLRLQAIATEAAEQTGRLDVPRVIAPEKLDRMLDGWEPDRRLVFCDEGGGVPPAIEALGGLAAGPGALLIGPEGGFAPEEGERLRALPFVTAVSLGPRILRADTATIAAPDPLAGGVGRLALAIPSRSLATSVIVSHLLMGVLNAPGRGRGLPSHSKMPGEARRHGHDRS